MTTQRRLFGLLAKKETTAFTDAVPVVGTDGVRLLEAFEPVIGHEWPNRMEDAASGTLGRPKPAAARGRVGRFSFVTEFKGTRAGTAIAAANLPPVSPLLQCAGYSEVVVTTPGSETATYTPADASHATATLYYYWGGKLYKVVGCRGSARILFEPGRIARAQWDIMGLVTAITNTALGTITSYGTVRPPPFTSAGMTIGAWTLSRYNSVEFDLGADVQLQAGGNAAEGIAGFDIIAHLPRVRVTPRVPDLTDIDPYADVRTPTPKAIDWAYGATQYNTWDVSVPQGYVVDPGHENQDGLAGYSLEFECPYEAGDSRPTLVLS